MDILKMLAELRSEREQLDEAILTLQRLAAGQGKRRGRPPKWMSATKPADETPVEPEKKRTMSAAGRKKVAAAQKKRWAAKKAEAKEAVAS